MGFQKIAVIGSGVMGAGIAAQITNAGVDVVLLDIKVPGKDLAAAAVDRLLKTDPAPFMDPANAKRITTGNLEDDLPLLGACDWIIEVVLEDLSVKHETYKKIIAHRKAGAIVSSNTSTIPLAQLCGPFDAGFKQDFMITHFFNPPRYMRLLELVTGPDTRPEAIATIRDFCDIHLGKGVVVCKDTPGFIANRLGVFWLQAALNEAMKQSVSIEIADAVLSKPVGIPKTGVFGLIDLVGIDLMPKLAASMLSSLPETDAYRSIYTDHPFIARMIEAGYTGRKGKGGFYRLDMAGGKKTKQALVLNPDRFDPETSYRLESKPKLESVDAGKKGLGAVVTHNDAGGRYARAVLFQVLHYAASLVPDIADSIADIDAGMKLGYNWKFGPFEMIDQLGPAWFADQLRADGVSVPPIIEQVGSGTFYQLQDGRLHVFGPGGSYTPLMRPDGVLLLSDIKRAKGSPVFKTGSAALWDLDDGVLCLEFTGKMNALDDQVFAAIDQAVKITGPGKTYQALVIHNESDTFSAGANLGLAIFAMNIALWPQIDELVAGGQRAYKALQYAPFPVVAAPSGLALGGGCEILLHADHVQAHAETYCGLVEVGVGLIPGWGGCKEMILRYRDDERAATQKLWFSPSESPMGAVRKAFETIGTAQVAKSAFDAKRLRYLRASDGITMNRDRLLFDAKQRALALVDGYAPREPAKDIRLPGPSGKAALDLAVADLKASGKATAYDVVVSDHLAHVLTGGAKGDWTNPMTEEDLLRLEREEFAKLVRKQGTIARVEHMLNTGKPLRN